MAIITTPAWMTPVVVFSPIWIFYHVLQSKGLSNTQIVWIGVPLMLLPLLLFPSADPLTGGSMGVWTTMFAIRVFEVATLPRKTQQQWTVTDVYKIVIVGWPRSQRRKPVKNTIWTHLSMVGDFLFFHIVQWLVVAYFRKYGFQHNVYLVDITNIRQAVDHILVAVVLYSTMRAMHIWRLMPMILYGEPVPALFDYPFRAHSMRDLWANRWNLPVQASLERGIYRPILKWLAGNKVKGDITSTNRNPIAPAIATMATFLVSGLQHEMFNLHLAPDQSFGPNLIFFLSAGVFCVLEGLLQRVTGYGVSWGTGIGWIWLNWIMTMSTLIILSPLFLRPYIFSGLYFYQIPAPEPIIEFYQHWI
ncbi:hypothetical protein BDR26DRAFT_1007502 [Obelidium mucronatum]|nr:hypothetical protein BDR26DRAFT_1007502 [Obelidium mucronatum]